jgi:2-haloacid dehalogenase
MPAFNHLKNAGYQMNILSNGKIETLQKASTDQKIDHHLTKIFSSESIRKYKVHPQIYQQITDHFNVKAHQCIFISSNQWDISGASTFGFQTIWLNRKDEPLEIITKSPDFIVRSLMELPEIS